MTTRDPRTSRRLLATLLLAPLALPVQRAEAQTVPPANVPSSAPGAAVPPPPPVQAPAAVSPAPIPPAAAPAEPVPPPLPPELPPSQLQAQQQDVIPEPPPLPPMPDTLPPAVPQSTPQLPPAASTEVPVKATDAEPAFVSADGGEHHGHEPLFDVGSYKIQASGYVQGQYQNFQQSENQLSADGQRLLNNTGFFVPRARLVVEGANKWSGVVLEYDVANINSQFVGVQRAEATLHWRNPKSNVPYLATTMGVFRTPFGSEAQRSARLRYYAENATITQAYFPGQADLGFRAEGGVAWFRYALAFVNGHPINEPRFGGRAPTKQGDALGRLGVDADLGPIRIIGGGSLLKGRGFTPGLPATKDQIVVRDVNEAGVVTPQNVTLVPGRPATESRRFERWGAGADLELSGNVADVWQFWARGEFMFGQNLDRALFIADPIAQGFNQRSWGGVASLDNILWQIGLLGFRYDTYNPNPDATSRVSGSLVKVAREIQTYTFLVGLQLPGTNTRIFAEYDRVKDNLALSTLGVPGDLKNNRFILRLQVSLW